jgi:G2/mitotic-specific cyclin 2
MHYAYKLLPETLFLSVNLIDRFLSARKVSTAKLALVGIACLFIACKAEEIVSPSIRDIIARSGVEFGDAEALKAERYVLQTLEWNINYPNPMNFLRRISKADEYEITVRTVGKYLLEVACLEWRLLDTPPSLQAAAAMWLARLVLGREEWVREDVSIMAASR